MRESYDIRGSDLTDKTISYYYKLIRYERQETVKSNWIFDRSVRIGIFVLLSCGKSPSI